MPGCALRSALRMAPFGPACVSSDVRRFLAPRVNESQCHSLFMSMSMTHWFAPRAAQSFPFRASSHTSAIFTSEALSYIAGAQAAQITHGRPPSVSASSIASPRFSPSRTYSSTTSSRASGLASRFSIHQPARRHPTTLHYCNAIPHETGNA